jgi:hypothetical protein
MRAPANYIHLMAEQCGMTTTQFHGLALLFSINNKSNFHLHLGAILVLVSLFFDEEPTALGL